MGGDDIFEVVSWAGDSDGGAAAGAFLGELSMSLFFGGRPLFFGGGPC